MSKKILIGLIVVVVLVAATLALRGNDSSLGAGSVHNTTETFDEGIAVDGTTIIDGSGNFDGAVTAGSASTFASTVAVEGLLAINGGYNVDITAITTSTALTAADCGNTVTVSAGLDGGAITLPEASTVIGCTYNIVYIGADGGALLDITPLDSDADGIEGSCTLAASVVNFSGTADADIGLTKATILTGDTVSLTALTSAMWSAHDIQGICANN